MSPDTVFPCHPSTPSMLSVAKSLASGTVRGPGSESRTLRLKINEVGDAALMDFDDARHFLL